MDKADKELFRQAVLDAVPLSHDRDTSRPQPAPVAVQQTAADEAQVMSELLLYGPEQLDADCGEELCWSHTNLQASVIRQLKRGKIARQDEIDLHGLRLPVAEQVILEFIQHSQERGYRCVRIIHGKGLRSRGQPVLKQLTAKLLRRHPFVLAYCSARVVDGGTGAVYVLLKR